MSFQEKVRWIAFVTTLVIWGWYFTGVAVAIMAGEQEIGPLGGRLLLAAVVSLVIQVGGIIAVAAANPKEATINPDERDLQIERRAITWAYHIMWVGLFGVVIGAYLGWNMLITLNAVMFVFLIAEIVRCSLEIAAYRRGV